MNDSCEMDLDIFVKLTCIIAVNLFLATEINSYYLETSTENYVYQDNLPKLDELTVCLWVQALDTDVDGLGAESLLSIATRENMY